jgi:hypothetical protein
VKVIRLQWLPEDSQYRAYSVDGSGNWHEIQLIMHVHQAKVCGMRYAVAAQKFIQSSRHALHRSAPALLLSVDLDGGLHSTWIWKRVGKAAAVKQRLH